MAEWKTSLTLTHWTLIFVNVGLSPAHGKMCNTLRDCPDMT